jgi:hypothetical protein
MKYNMPSGNPGRDCYPTFNFVSIKDFLSDISFEYFEQLFSTQKKVFFFFFFLFSLWSWQRVFSYSGVFREKTQFRLNFYFLVGGRFNHILKLFYPLFNVLWNSWIQLSLRNEPVECISLNECISDSWHCFLYLTIYAKPDIEIDR